MNKYEIIEPGEENNRMTVRKRINITIHEIELNKLDRIKQKHNETRSGMITRLINEYKE